MAGGWDESRRRNRKHSKPDKCSKNAPRTHLSTARCVSPFLDWSKLYLLALLTIFSPIRSLSVKSLSSRRVYQQVFSMTVKNRKQISTTRAMIFHSQAVQIVSNNFAYYTKGVRLFGCLWMSSTYAHRLNIDDVFVYSLCIGSKPIDRVQASQSQPISRNLVFLCPLICQ